MAGLRRDAGGPRRAEAPARAVPVADGPSGVGQDYARAARGEIRNFTGVDNPYEPPARPDLRLDTEALSAEECVELVTERLVAGRAKHEKTG